MAIVNQIQPVSRGEIAVLIVDDILPIVEEMLTFMELCQVPVVAASSLDEAVLALEDCPNISVIICDVRLGNDSGFDLPDHVRAKPALAARQLDYVFVTGDPMGVDQLPSGLNFRILAKPVRPQELLELINSLRTKAS